LLTCLLVTTAEFEPSPEELLDSIALSQENISRFYPRIVENINEKIRAYVAGIIPFDNVCKGTYKPNLCTNKLRKPIETLMKAFTSLIDNISRNETTSANDAHCALKKQLKKLSNDKVLAIPPYLMADYNEIANGTLIKEPRERIASIASTNTTLEESISKLKNRIELIKSMVRLNGVKGFNVPAEMDDLLKKLNLFEASLKASG
ncbi:hypothetical protein PMAYCL1PPCAC_19156, partial [Pristionchus mayeri]